MSEKSCDFQWNSPELEELANSANNSVIPAKSKQLYEDSYKRFVKYCEEQQADDFSESVLLAYFFKLSKQYKSSTLWSNFSMIKAELNIRHNVNINTYTKLTAFLKHNGKGYTAKKSKVLTKQQFDEFLKNAPDNVYLATKIILIFGVTGACRCDELLSMTVNDITDLEKLILVQIPRGKPRSFHIIGDSYIRLYRKYAALRPKDITTARFFIKYQNSKCHRVVMGRHKIAQTAKEVASFLQLPNPSEYTGHCLRKTSATISVEDCGDTPLSTQQPAGEKKLHEWSAAYNLDKSFNSDVNFTQPIEHIKVEPEFGDSEDIVPEDLEINEEDSSEQLDIDFAGQCIDYALPCQSESNKPAYNLDKPSAYDSDGQFTQPIGSKEFCDDVKKIDDLEMKEEDSGEQIYIEFAEQCLDYAIKYLKQCTKTHVVNQVMFLEKLKKDLPTYE
ncbi:unnamed protein product [Brassicogethes aeneus]|uniref:Tyr recombinase domain-containing protein n=1 Tax=Brassicogethes aeneus TaxID=1431903 RepID=A0A9P0APV5_BRAAE|nr:unnamed protein product [Brassicogethes aeneus]